jgi:hypothetical protein
MTETALGFSTSVTPTIEEVYDHFNSSPYPHLVAFVSSVENAEVILSGVAISFHSKQLAQNVAAHCPGITKVNNLIRVDYASNYRRVDRYANA